MAWLGALLGVLLGVANNSLTGAAWMAIIGAVLGFMFSRKNKESARDTPETAELRAELRTLQEKVHRMSLRLSALEAGRGADAAASAAGSEPASDAPAFVPPAELGPHALAALVAATTTAARAQPAGADMAGAMPEAAHAPLHAQEPPPVGPPADETRNAPQAPFAAAEKPAAPAGPAQAPAAAAPRAPVVPPEPSRLQSLIQRWIFGGNPMVKIGVLILFLGLAFLLRFAAEHTVVPIGVRYAGVAATAIGLLLFGWRWRNRADSYGVILQGAGIGALYLTTLAAMRLHPLIPMQFGFAVLIAVAVFAALLAILQNALALAIVGTLFGFAAPVLASTGSANHVGLFSYMALLNLGIIAIAWFKTWRVLSLLGFACSILLGCAWGAKYYQPALFATSEPFLLLLFVLYVLAAFLFARRTLAEAPAVAAGFEDHVRQAAPRVSYVDGTLVFGVPITCFGLQVLLTRHIEYGAAFSALGFGIAYVLLAFLLFRRSGMRYALLNETMLALAVVFGSLAIPLGLEQKWTAAAWAVEAAGVYWVGVRQGRVHARLFALLLLFGSAFYFALGVRPASDGAVLEGSLLGCVMLACSIWFCYRLLRRAPAAQLHDFEQALRPWLVASGAFFVALAPFFLWEMDWASTALALLGAVAVWAAQRLGERTLLAWGMLYQAIAGALFATTLRSAGGGSVLSNGWTGLFAASLIGAAMLAAAWVMVRASNPAATAADGTAKDDSQPSAISGAANLGLLAGLAFINLAPLFVLPWRYAAMVWPLAGIATLWWALRARHALAIGFALALQAIAGAAHLGSHLRLLGNAPDLAGAGAFAHTGFWGPLLIACAAFLCARLLQRPASPVAERPLGAVALFWACAWWALAWAQEVTRLVPPDAKVAVLLLVAINSAWLWSVLAQRLHWPQLGRATLAYVPVLILLAYASLFSPLGHPLASWGALVWPLALALHALLLRRQAAWGPQALVQLAHVGGAWLFVVVAAIELRWQFASLADAGSAWPLLGWMIAPVIYLAALTSQRLRQRWPLRDFADAYVLVSAAPVALYLLGWAWVTNAASDGAAAPLPYVPLINPLELAQFAVLAAVALWWQSVRTHPRMPATAQAAPIAIGASAFALITGMVVRTCHHWGGVPWEAAALQRSTLVQTSLSIAWSLMAIGLMLYAHRRRQRWIWIVGAVLVGLVVVKLFLVDMAARGSVTRIVSFMGVGMLLLVVGYFAPLPPRRDSQPASHPELAGMNAS